MIKKNKALLWVAISTIFFTLLFNNQWIGLNVLIFESLIFGILYFSKQINLKNKSIIFITLAYFLTALAVVFVNSTLAIFINMLICFIAIGILIFPEARSLTTTIQLSFYNIFTSQSNALYNISNINKDKKESSSKFRRIRIFLIPIVIIIIFLIIYSNSNPVFENILSNFIQSINKFLNNIFRYIDIDLSIVILLGLLSSNYIFFRNTDQHLENKDKAANDFLQRIRKRVSRQLNLNSLTNELKAAIFLLAILNIIILILNVIDIYWVWFNFSWDGALLKQFVHEGTYLLILSIIISIIIVLYYFRGNLNFYKNNIWLKRLSYAWIMQNAILAISVGIRNYWYIYYYSLAYKRIAVIVFLILTLYGLYTVYQKVKDKKSAFYLIRSNLRFTVLILVISSLFNWDTIIARYNFSQSYRAYVHFDFLASLSYKALPYLEKPLAELSAIEKRQNNTFPLTRGLYINAIEYKNRIEIKKTDFKKQWESKGILSWNYPEYKAYQKLFGSNK